MRDTYAKARRVIVIDVELMAFESHHDVQRTQQIVLSDWMTRLWTYQEACLAGSKLSIVFFDSIQPIERFYTSRLVENDERDPLLKLPLLKLPHASELANGFLRGQSGYERLLVAAEDLHKRETTHENDEPICLASVLGVDVRNLPARPTMVDLYKDVRPILQNIIFAPGPRCDTVGFRSLPGTFLKQEPYSLHHTTAEAKLDSRGLWVEKKIARFNRPLEFKPRPGGIRRYHLTLVHHVTGKELGVLDVERRQLGRDCENNKQDIVISRAILVFEGSESLSQRAGDQAIIAEVTEERKDHLYAHFRGLALYTPTLAHQAYEEALPKKRWKVKLDDLSSVCMD